MMIISYIRSGEVLPDANMVQLMCVFVNENLLVSDDFSLKHVMKFVCIFVSYKYSEVYMGKPVI